MLTRHSGNLAQLQSKKGDDTLWTREFANRHTSNYRLTDLGRQQARVAGDWIRNNISESFDTYFCSEYIR